MNGVRTTFLRRGYLLTALAAAVLLAASPGIASAQEVSWSTSKADAYEGASAAANTPALLTVTVTRTGTVPQDSTEDAYWGTISVLGLGDNDGVALTNVPGAGTIGNDGAITWINNGASVMIAGDADDDWLDDELTLRLRSTQSKVDFNTQRLDITIHDAHVQPVARFSKGSISLTEDSTTTVNALVGVESAQATDVPGALANISEGTVRVMVTPADALYNATSNPNGPLEISVGTDALVASAAPNNKPGMYDLDTIVDLVAATTNGKKLTGGVTVTVKARTDTSGFTDPMVTVAFDAPSLKTASGQVMAGAELMIEVQSDEEIPVVGFVPTSLTLDEGGDGTFAILAEGKYGPEVGEADVMVSGDARIMLTGDNVTAGDDVDDYGNGTYTVDLGDSASTKVTVMAKGDESLQDGDMKTAMLKLVSADDATIGADNEVSVTVRGSTSVPALPLVAQLLLALFLMAGGSRLYRRRRG